MKSMIILSWIAISDSVFMVWVFANILFNNSLYLNENSDVILYLEFAGNIILLAASIYIFAWYLYTKRKEVLDDKANA